MALLPSASGRRERDLDDELQAFVDELTAQPRPAAPPEAARRAALVETGGMQHVREATREVWTFALVESLLRDIIDRCRMLAQTPGFSLVILATLPLVRGANATVFSVMHAVLWRASPYPDADRLVVVNAHVRGAARAGLSGGETLDLRAEPDLFDALAYIIRVDAHLNIDGELERVAAVSLACLR